MEELDTGLYRSRLMIRGGSGGVGGDLNNNKFTSMHLGCLSNKMGMAMTSAWLALQHAGSLCEGALLFC